MLNPLSLWRGCVLPHFSVIEQPRPDRPAMFKRLNESLGETVTVTIDGQPTRVPAGETVAAAVLAHGTRFSRTTAISGAPRAPYCMMGVCFECMMVVDGRANVRACMERVRDGMRIEVQHGAGGQRE